MNLYFTYEPRDTRLSLLKLNPEHGDKFEIKISTISRGSRSPDNAKFGHFSLLGSFKRSYAGDAEENVD